MPSLKVETEIGEFSIQLHDDRAPHTCHYFSNLISRGALDDGAIFRITTAANYQSSNEPPIEVVQIGTPLGLNEPRQRIPHEATSRTGLKHRRFTVSASRFDPGELYASFFICMRDEPALDFGGGRRADGQGYAAFGEVATGRSTLERIFASAGAEELLAIRIPILSIQLSRPTPNI